ncbi:hypothetical protein GYA27_03860, partial [candidate division WWE3 bacterium]|nr:hypothetical protein [candidate division WWE3 bacterium]
MKGKVLEVWSAYHAHPDNLDILNVVVRIENQRVHYADYFISLGEFEAKGSAEEDALPKLTFAPANPDPTVTTAMWVPVEY